MQIIPPPVRWGIPHGILVVSLIPVVLGTAYLVAISGLVPVDDLFQFVLSMAGYVIVLIALVVVSRRRGLGPAPADVQRRATVIAILISSAAFAALHLAQAPGDLALLLVLGLGTFVVGVLHAVVTVVTGRLGAAMVSHVLYNGSSVLLLVLLGGAVPGA